MVTHIPNCSLLCHALDKALTSIKTPRIHLLEKTIESWASSHDKGTTASAAVYSQRQRGSDVQKVIKIHANGTGECERAARSVALMTDRMSVYGWAMSGSLEEYMAVMHRGTSSSTASRANADSISKSGRFSGGPDPLSSYKRAQLRQVPSSKAMAWTKMAVSGPVPCENAVSWILSDPSQATPLLDAQCAAARITPARLLPRTRCR